MSGKPVIKGTRIPVATILRWLGQGVSQDALLAEYPTLTKADIHAAQSFALRGSPALRRIHLTDAALDF
jgi:uncharacterized protein (DUF433 family)